MKTTNRYRPSAGGIVVLAAVMLMGTLPLVAFGNEMPADLQIVVDATEMGRRIIRSTVSFERGGDSLTVLYPKWIPGMHGPCGPIENLAGFRVNDQSGAAVAWQRDYADPFRFRIEDAAVSYPLTITLTYICGQPTAISWGDDCEGTNSLGVINWNAVTVYPEGTSVRNLTVEPRLVLPSGWRFATAMPATARSGDTIVFAPVT